MKPGPAPKPSALRKLEGRVSHRPLNDNEPIALIGEPECPRHLNAIARKEWRRLCPLLLSMGVLSETDGIALGNLCNAYATLISAQRLMNKASKGPGSGLLIKSPNGYLQQSPLLSIVNRQIEIVNRLLSEFGLTPSSRTRVDAISPACVTGGIGDPLERALCGDPRDFEIGGKLWKTKQ